jgi:hypothetical protein
MRLGRGFFEVQVQFARQVAALTGRALAETLLTHTNLSVRFGLGRNFDPAHPLWQRYLVGLEGQPDPTDWTHQFHSSHALPVEVPGFQAQFGCFSYGLLGVQRARLHFHPSSLGSSLGSAHILERKLELRRLIEHVRHYVGMDASIVGASWLYNLPAYRRLFPPAYLETARVRIGGFQSMSLWGQFVHRDSVLIAGVQRDFLARLEQCANLNDLDSVFAFPALELEAGLEAFDPINAPRASSLTG